MTEYKLVVIKSTVPVGTNEQVVRWIGEAQREPVSFDVISNPEFLREGSALHDALHPDRVVIGSTNKQATAIITALYKDMTCPLIVTKPQTAEMIKYAANAFFWRRKSPSSTSFQGSATGSGFPLLMWLTGWEPTLASDRTF